MRKKTLERQEVTTKIGNLPPSWKAVSLKDVTDPCAPIRYGVVQIGPNTPGGVPIVPIKHIKKIKDVTLHCASSDIEAAYAGSRVKGGDVLLSVKGTIGEIGVVPNGFEGNIAREIARIRPVTSCDAYFLAFQLEADHTQRRIDSQTVGSTRLEFSIHAVRDFLIALPPLAEQKKIAAILRTWDEAIEKIENLIAAKESESEWICAQTILFFKKRLDLKDTKIKDFLRKDFNIEKGKPLKGAEASEGDVPVIAGGKTSPYTHNKPTHTQPCVTVSASGAYAGYIWYHQAPIWASDCNVIYSLTGSTKYLYYVLKSQQHEVYALQSGGAQPHVYARDIQNLRIVLPDADTQKKIVSLLDTAEQGIFLLHKKLEKLKAQKRGLMQKLLTGEWPVRVEKEAV